MTSTAPMVSVIIPTRNRADIVPRAVRSILDHATSISFEVVIVDNDSSDDTAAVVSSLAHDDARVTIVHETTIGRAAALNAGITAARADRLVFTDDDVTVEDGWLEAWSAFFDRHPGPVLGGGTILPAPPEGEWPTWFSERALVAVGWRRWADERVLTDADGAWGANMAARRETFDRFGWWREDSGVRGTMHPRNHEPEDSEDSELQTRVRSAGGETWSCPAAVVRHSVERPRLRAVLAKGFANGRNTRLRGSDSWTWPGDRSRVAGSVSAWTAWIGAGSRSILWCALLRARPTRWTFEHAWSALWQLGWRMDDLLAGGRRGRLDRRVRGATRRLERGALRLAPER